METWSSLSQSFGLLSLCICTIVPILTRLSISARTAVQSSSDRPPLNQSLPHQERLVELAQRDLWARADTTYGEDSPGACGYVRLPIKRVLVVFPSIYAAVHQVIASKKLFLVDLRMALRNTCRSRFEAYRC